MSIENQIADKQSEVKSLIQLNLKSGSNTEKYDAEIAKIYAEIMTLRQQLKRAKNEVENNIKINEGVARAAKWIEENSMVFDEYDDVIVRRLVDTIQVNGDDTITVFLKGGVQITEGIK